MPRTDNKRGQKKQKIGMVILKYNGTIECIVNQSFSEYKVIIVDNHSENESFKFIQSIKNKSKFNILQSSKNLGYAEGNNMSIRYLIDNFNITNVFVCN
jgi:GT2 family glycosyltransferase